MLDGFWVEYSVLLLAAIVGSVAILPFSLRLFKESAKKKPKLSLNILLLLSVLQNTILFAVVIGVGLLAEHQIGLSNPILQALITGREVDQAMLLHMLIALLLGIGSGGILLIADLFFLPYLPDKLLQTALKTTQMENFTASFYGGINEELLTRLFGVSVIAWLVSRFWHTSTELPTTAVFLSAIMIMALLFALGHLPALKSVSEKITPLLLSRTILLNMIVGLICGWLFWNYGIITAMIAHFSADIIYHVCGTFVLQRKYAKNTKDMQR